MEYFIIKWKLIPDGEKAKPSSHQMLVQETGITEAETAFGEYMRDSTADYEIISISKSKISEVLINTNPNRTAS